MAKFPAVNWWRGVLRPHESRLAFIARFSDLNGLVARQAELYFQEFFKQMDLSANDKLLTLADALGEDLDVLRTVLFESIHPGHDHSFSIPSTPHTFEVRYCEDCAKFGYHSYLHEYGWLRLCPFHLTPLKLATPGTYRGSSLVARCETLSELMREGCPSWPMPPSIVFKPEQFASFNWMTDWLSTVRSLATKQGGKPLWASNEVVFPKAQALGAAIGRLHALEAIPEGKRCMFSNLEEGWGAEICHFPLDAKQEFARLESFGHHTLFLFFKRISAYSNHPFDFTLSTSRYRTSLLDRHQKCHCRWGCEKIAFGSSHWVAVEPDEWPYWNLKCPFLIALEKLEEATGHWEEALSVRKRQDQHFAMLPYVDQLASLGIVKLAPHAQVTPEGRLYAFQQTWPFLEWIGTPWLNSILDTAARMEAAMVYDHLVAWLDSIDDGSHPGRFTQSPTKIELHESEGGLQLIRWHRSMH